jgi:Spx/MgsR family transcriptional regulator
MSKAVVYGIPNCDTVKRARAWLAAQGQTVEFFDFKRQGVPAAELALWIAEFGWERVLNRQGTTWRKLEAAAQAAAQSAEGATALALAQPSVIRRPILAKNGQSILGFDATSWSRLLGS